MRTAFWILGNILRLVRAFRGEPQKSPGDFVSRAMAGEFSAPLEEVVDDEIDAWHDSSSGKALHEYLGFTWDEYSSWAEGDSTVEEILRRRTLKR